MTPLRGRNIKWLGHSELGGRPDGVQVMFHEGYAYVGHPFSGGGATVVDVRDPRNPTPVNFLPVHPRSWSLHFQTFDRLLLVAEEFNFIARQPKSKWRDPDCGAGLRVYDLGDPANPRPIGFMPVEGLGLHRGVVDRRAICLCVRASGWIHGSHFHLHRFAGAHRAARSRSLVGAGHVPGRR